MKTLSESQLRRRAARSGAVIRKDRARSWGLDHQGGYMVVDAETNCILSGARFDLDLDDLMEIFAPITSA